MHNYSVNPISRPGLPVQSSLSFDRPSDVDWVTSEVIFGRICDPPIDPATQAARAAYTDERYFVEISRPTSTVTQDGELAVEADPTVDSRQRIVTAYNTGEFLSGTHTLQVGELVRLRKRVYDYATRRVVMYVFSSGGGGGVVTVKITGSSGLGGGKYYGRILTGSSTVVANASNLSMPEGRTVPDSDNCLFLHVAESGYSSHVIPVNSYVFGLIVGTADDGKMIVEGIGANVAVCA